MEIPKGFERFVTDFYILHPDDMKYGCELFKELADMAYIGGFHHTSCPYLLRSETCVCANQFLRNALDKYINWK